LQDSIKFFGKIEAIIVIEKRKIGERKRKWKKKKDC